jgi:uncharacterized protein (DUF2141 family)
MKYPLVYIPLFFLIIFAAVHAAFAGQNDTVRLAIHVTGFDSSEGVAKVALVNSQENYDSEDAPFMGFNFIIINNEVLQTIRVPQGEYAIKVYHDENANDEMDTLMFGIPSEKYGFSNNARGTLGPPAFDKARFTADKPEHRIEIKVE